MPFKNWLTPALLMIGSLVSGSAAHAAPDLATQPLQTVRMCLATDVTKCLDIPVVALSTSLPVSASTEVKGYAGTKIAKPTLTLPPWATNIHVGLLDQNTLFLFYSWVQADMSTGTTTVAQYGFTGPYGGELKPFYSSTTAVKVLPGALATEVVKTPLGEFQFPRSSGLVAIDNKPVYMYWPSVPGVQP
ncbi:MAG: hypothetical protein WC045_01540 [Patescibacteria group bacterium]